MSAGNIKLNLKEFKHVSSDKNKTILEHKKGHRLELAHGSLSPESRQQLEELAKGNPKLEESRKTPPKAKMADGGETPRWDQMSGPAPADPHQSNDPDYNDKTTSDQDTQRHQQADEADKRGKAMGLYAKGGGIENPAAGLDFNTAKEENEAAYNAGLPCLNPHCKSHGQPHPNCRCYSGEEAYAKGGYVEGRGNDNPSAKEEYFCDMPRHHFKSCEYAHGGEVSQQGNDVKHANREKQRGNSGAAQQQMNYAKSEAKGRAEFERQVKPNMKGLKDGGDPKHAPYLDVPEEQPADITAVPTEMTPDSNQQDAQASNSLDTASGAPGTPMAGPGLASPPQDAAEQTVGDQEQPQEDQSQAQAPQATAPAPNQDVAPGKQAAIQQQVQEQNNPIQRFQDHKVAAEQYYMSEDQDWANDLRNGHVKPETYESLFANKSTPGKLGTIFGLLLSGAGSGLAHQQNAALGMLQQTIQNDLQAQQHSKDNAVNYLRLSQQHEVNKANINATNAETAIKTNALALMKANRAALQVLVANVNKYPEGSPEKAKAQQALAFLNDAVQQGQYRIADQAAVGQAYYQMLGAGQQSQSPNSEAAFQQRNQNLQSGMVGEKGKAMGQYEAERHIPNLPSYVSGHSTNPVPQDIRSQLHVQNVLDTKGKDLLSFIHQHSGTWNPQNIALAKQKVEEMKNFYNGSIEGGQLTAGRLKWYEDQFSNNPTSLINQIAHGSTKRIEEVINSNTMRRDQQLKDLGYTVGAPKASGQKIERFDPKSGKTAVYDSNKKFLNWK